MKTFIFDMDDTIYDQIIPFKKSLEDSGFRDLEDIQSLYIQSRIYSDSVFAATQNGTMSNLDMRRYRIQKPLEDLGIIINNEQADYFQERYAFYLDHLELHPSIQDLFTILAKRNIPFYILTNGPSEHQWKKIKALRLEKYLPTHRIIVSGDIGHYKPSREIFQVIEAQQEGTLTMIGDSLPNDVIGAKNAGWEAVWFNHRRREGTYEGLTLFSFSQIKAYVLNSI
ncbi:HAD family hydrolase [Erysipelothrix amsterdamensis]|uniref:HAD family hydrolase n=1 Tax=Erysipelothrix amsterdamensis TaxID=2929157 RepID=A0AAU9VEV2_9FIRM|nr:HAD-IA family hydrolase [Erysipelothrix rhusiopathiae]CAH2760791.1 HAD family hydrolase [Erysipelothrix sp. A18Y020d]AYV35326.1 HAD family hydrolase [Erysipelothrix rhusiopathiae]MDE8081353.1 HAD-IA family hydrolase [Erysipelothrix rhusiopathiae]MDE8314140.1 HAD-IA family hydrolase [Erysipelothrix rhusiopathiae]CAH2760802.1 HAD family hydrolase [Erysipelothrix sp. A18Y020d]